MGLPSLRSGAYPTTCQSLRRTGSLSIGVPFIGQVFHNDRCNLNKYCWCTPPVSLYGREWCRVGWGPFRSPLRGVMAVLIRQHMIEITYLQIKANILLLLTTF